MLSIKPKTAFTNILEGGLPPTAINGHFDRYKKIILSKPPAVLYDSGSQPVVRVPLVVRETFLGGT